MNFTIAKVSQLNAERLAKVLPELAEKCAKLIGIAYQEGFTLLVTQGFRSIAEQNALYAQGRTKPGKIVTNAKGSQSNHTRGEAVDFAFIVNGEVSWEDKLYLKIGGWAKQVGLNWGGDWRSIKDKPHVELPSKKQPQASQTPETISSVINIEFGMKGEAVRQLQTALFNGNYLKFTDIDGDFGPTTKKAVINFQLAHGLRTDGIVGPNTAKLLGL